MPHSLPATRRAALLALIRLGGPVAMQALLGSALALVDALMVSNVGPAALGGVGLVGRLMFVLTMVLAGLASGLGALVAQMSGAGRLRAARGPVLAAVLFGLCLTLPMALACLLYAAPLASLLSPDAAVADAAATFLRWSAAYAPLTALSAMLAATLRGSGNTRTPMWAGGAALLINTALNLVFISGRFGMPAYGVAAAAAATSVARLVEVGWLYASTRSGPLWRLARHWRRRDASLVLHSTSSLMLKELAWAGGVLASAVIIGRMGEVPLAAYNLVLPVEGAMISLVSGCGVATAILLGHALGRDDRAGALASARQLLRMVSWSALAAGMACATLVQALRYSNVLAGALAPGLLDPALQTLSVLCLGFGARAHNTMVSIGILRSGNDARWLFWADLVSMWAINVPLVALVALGLHWSLPAVVAVMMMEEVGKLALFSWRVNSGRWLRRYGSGPAALRR